MEDIKLDITRNRYGAILNLPHPSSRNHPRMAVRDRAAQFAPFAALNGFEAAIQKAEKKHEPLFLSDENDATIRQN